MTIAALMSRIGITVRPESWQTAAQQLEKSLCELGYDERCIASAHMAWLLFFADEEELSLPWIERSFNLPKQFQISIEAQCIVDTHVGEIIHCMGDLDHAFSVLQPAATLALSHNPPLTAETRCNASRAYGSVLSSMGHLDVATEWLFEASHLARSEESTISPIFRAAAFRLYGSSKLSGGALAEAAHFTMRAVKVVMAADVDVFTECNAFLTYGEVLLRLERFDEAGLMLAKAVQIQRNNGADRVTTCRAYRHYGQFLVKTGRPAEAVPWLRDALQYSIEKTGSHALRLNCALMYSEALILNGQLDEADSVLLNSLTSIDEHGCDPLTQLGIQAQLGKLRVEQSRHLEAAEIARVAQRTLFAHLRRVADPGGVDETVMNFSWLFALPRKVSRAALGDEEEKGRTGLLLWLLLESLDAQKCVWIRETLYRRTFATQADMSIRSAAPEWQAGPSDWLQLFPATEKNYQDELATKRTIRGGASTRRTHRRIPLVEQAHDRDRAQKNEFCRPIEPEEMHEMVSPCTVLLNFYFDEEDLLCLPAQRDRRTDEVIFKMPPPGGDLFCIPKIRRRLEEFIREHQKEMIAAVVEDVSDGTFFEERRFAEHRAEQQRVYGDLYEMLNLKTLLDTLELRSVPARSMRLVIVPDGPLYQVPFHAAWCADRKAYFYEQVASIGYALSLRTLSLQYQIDRSDSSPSYPLRATVFANSRGDSIHQELHNVRREVGNLMLASRGRDVETIRVFGNHPSGEATIAQHHQWHNKGNALFHVGHGDRFELAIATRSGEVKVDRPGVLLSDGPLVDIQMQASGYDFRNVRVMFNNNCTLGQLELEEYSGELEGYMASMTLMGCRRLVCASWELDDEAAADFAGYYFRALLEHAFVDKPQDHAFAFALSNAVSQFRRDHERYDHPYFWAPYVMYGVP